MRALAASIALAAIPLAGCIGPTAIETREHWGNVATLVEFHDQGVEWELGAGLIAHGQAAQWTDESFGLLKTFEDNDTVPELVVEGFLPVAERVERYADEQPDLTDFGRMERRTYSAVFRRMLGDG